LFFFHIINCLIFRQNIHNKAYKKGLNKGSEMVIETLKEIAKENIEK